MAWGWKLAAGPREERRTLAHEQLAPRAEVRLWATSWWPPSSFFLGKTHGDLPSEWGSAKEPCPSPSIFFLGRTQGFHSWEPSLASSCPSSPPSGRSHCFQSWEISLSISHSTSCHLGPLIIWRPIQTWRAIWKAINAWRPILMKLVQVWSHKNWPCTLWLTVWTDNNNP